MTPKQKQAEEVLKRYGEVISSRQEIVDDEFIRNLLSSYTKGEIGEIEKCSDCAGCGNIMIEHGDIQHPTQCLRCNSTGKQPKGGGG